VRDGKSTVELHHVIGRANADEVTPVPGNLHRFLNDRFTDWPDVLRHNVCAIPC
jgi:hypothetical protein